MHGKVISAAASVALAISAGQLSAATLYWQGGAGNLTDANYTDGVTANLAPVAGDLVRFGAPVTGTGTLSGGSASLGTLWVGHNEAINPSTTNAAAVTVNNGATLSLAGGGISGSPTSGLVVGHTRGGTLNIDGAGTSVTSNQLVTIGYATNQPNRNGTINITNGASLIVSTGNINMGDSGGATNNGIQGHLNVDGTVSVLGGGADINLGIRKATATVTQTGGLIEVADQIQVGFDGNGTNPASADSTYTISAGTTTTGVSGNGNFWIGRAASSGATLNLSGSGTLNVGNRLLMGSDTATGATTNHTGGTLNVDEDLRIGDGFTVLSDTNVATYNLSGNGIINANGIFKTIIGRRGKGVFNQSGGQANLGGTLSIGDQETANVVTAADGFYEISGGALTATGLSIAADGKGEFRVVGDDGSIDINGDFASGNTADGVGTLAFELEAGDLLSLIDVSGAATFANGSALVFDTTNAAPTLGVYDLLTATSIIDNGIAFSGPAGWSYQIVSGGNGQILQAVVPEPSTLGLVAAAGLLALRRRHRA